MSLGPLMVDIAGTELTPTMSGCCRIPWWAASFLFTRNYRDPAQVTALTAAIRALRSAASIDRGRSRGRARAALSRGIHRACPPRACWAGDIDEDRREGLSLAQSVGWLMASELRAVGVDFSFAPCVDLDYGVSEIIGDRAFHSDPDAVAALAVAYMAGMREAGMAAVAKHFPGPWRGGRRFACRPARGSARISSIWSRISGPIGSLIENNLAGVMARPCGVSGGRPPAGQPLPALDHGGAAWGVGLPWLRVRRRSDHGRSRRFWRCH